MLINLKQIFKNIQFNKPVSITANAGQGPVYFDIFSTLFFKLTNFSKFLSNYSKNILWITRLLCTFCHKNITYNLYFNLNIYLLSSEVHKEPSLWTEKDATDKIMLSPRLVRQWECWYFIGSLPQMRPPIGCCYRPDKVSAYAR